MSHGIVFRSGFVGRSSATLEKRIPINKLFPGGSGGRLRAHVLITIQQYWLSTEWRSPMNTILLTEKCLRVSQYSKSLDQRPCCDQDLKATACFRH